LPAEAREEEKRVLFMRSRGKNFIRPSWYICTKTASYPFMNMYQCTVPSNGCEAEAEVASDADRVRIIEKAYKHELCRTFQTLGF